MDATANPTTKSVAPAPDSTAPPPRPSLAQRSIDVVGATLSLLFAIVTLASGTRNIVPNNLTDSWLCVLHRAFLHHAVWGRDIVFTYGPWGFLFGGTRSETLAWWLAARVFLAATCWYALWRINAALFPRAIIRACWVFVGIALIAIGGVDLQIMVFPILLLLVATRDDRNDVKLVVLLCLASALCGWIKHSAGLVGLGVVVVIALVDLASRRVPVALLVYLLGAAAFYLLAHQPIAALPDYLRNHWDVLVGYGPAMTVTSLQAPRVMSFFIATSVMVLALVALQRQRSSYVALLVCGAVAAWLMVIFKECFVRQDQDPHMEIAGPAVLFALMVVVALPSRVRLASIGIAIAALVLGTFTANALHQHYISYPAKAVADELAKTPRRFVNFGATVSDLFRTNDPARSDDDFPPIDGPVDAIPWTGPYGFEQLRPRPVFQSYAAYTPRLAQLNADFLAGDDAPPKLLWRVDPLDRNFPTMEDPLVWAEALARYRYSGDVAGQLILSRKPHGGYRLAPLRETSSALGQWVDVPVSKSGRIWLKMQITPTHVGTLRSLIYRPSDLNLTIETAAGERSTFKLIVPITRCGFLLSPKLNETSNFKDLILSDPTASLRPLQVKRICVSPADAKAFVGYEPKLVYEFFDLELD